MSEMKSAKVKFRLKGNEDGPVYEGAVIVAECSSCKKSQRSSPPKKVGKNKVPEHLAEIYRSLEAQHRALGVQPGKIRFSEPQPKPVKATPERPATPPTLIPEILDSPRLRIEAHTLRFGDSEWINVFSQSMDDWSLRHDIPLQVWGDLGEKYPSPKFCEIDMLKAFLAGDSDWMIYFDADVFFHPSAPVPFFPEPGFYIMPDQPSGATPSFPRWLGKHYGVSSEGWIYRNAGVWACDRGSAEKMLSAISQPYIKGWQEQHAWNYWLMKASRDGLQVRKLPSEWNRFENVREPGWAWHFAGNRKLAKLRAVRALRYLPQEAEPYQQIDPRPHDRAIVYPWRASAAQWQELKYSLRSIDENFTDRECPIFIVGTEPPAWLKEGDRVKFLHCRSYQRALAVGVQLAEKILWMNDDIALMQPMGWEDFETPRHLGEMSRQRQEDWHWDSNTWKQGVARAITDLSHRGRSRFDCETHTPYVWRRGKAVEVLATYGIWHKIPMQTLYVNHHGILPVPMDGFRSSDPESDAPILNFVDRQLTDDFLDSYSRKFTNPSAWEITA